MPSSFPLHGALVHDDAVTFRVWAPDANQVTLDLGDKTLPLSATGNGLFERTPNAAVLGTRYRFRLDENGPFPDPGCRDPSE